MPWRYRTGADLEASWPLRWEHRLSRVALALEAPRALPQGIYLKRSVVRLPDAQQPWVGTVRPLNPETASAEDRPLRLVVVGDSTAVGCGVTDFADSLGGRMAHHLAAHTNRTVEYRAIGENGARTDEFIRDYLADARAYPADVIYVTLGANDTLAFRSRAAVARDVRHIVTSLREANPDAHIEVSCLPAFYRFELLPEPLRSGLYRHSQAIERTARPLVGALDRASMNRPPAPYGEGFFASDLFHPGAVGYERWAQAAVAEMHERGVISALTAP